MINVSSLCRVTLELKMTHKDLPKWSVNRSWAQNGKRRELTLTARRQGGIKFYQKHNLQFRR